MDKCLKILVAMGGPGSEHKVSIASGEAVLKALVDEGLDAQPLVVKTDTIQLPEGVDVVFNTIHGTFGEDGGLQRQLEMLGVSYTGAGLKSSELAFDKVASKRKFLEKGIPTPKSEIVDCSQGIKMPKMDIPYVVKPSKEGSSIGVHIVKTVKEAKAAMKDAVQYGDEVLIEQFVDGKELTVSVVGDEVFPIVHISPQDGFYDVSNKYPWLTGSGGTDYFCPAELPEQVSAEVKKVALNAHRSLGIEVYSRVDILLDSEMRPYVLEANTIPGMTESSLLPKAAKAAGYSFRDICKRILHVSLEVSRNESL